VAYWNQLSSFTNNGVGGSSISDARIDTYGIITSQLEKSAGTAFDYVIIQGGINDADTKTPAGTVTEGFDPSKFDTSTFAGGLENTFYTAARLYGETAAIGYVFNYAIPTAKRPHVNGIMEEYFVVVKAACEKWGIPYLDLFHNEQVRKDLNLSVAGAPELPDQLHVSTKGYNIISPYISDFFATLTPYSSE
jgi:lysophospholipase L1-like esterase